MFRQIVFSPQVFKYIALSSLAMILLAPPAKAQERPADYTFLVASGFLCNPSNAATCPALVKAANGESYQLSGAGTFNPQSKSASAAGTFSHESASGNPLETGVWIADRLIDFDSYGSAPDALMVGGRAFIRPQPGPNKRLSKFSGSMTAGGRVVLRVRLVPISGPPRIIQMDLNCALGKVPPEHQVDSIKLTYEAGGLEFAGEINKGTLFVLTSPAAAAVSKAQATMAETNRPPDATEH